MTSLLGVVIDATEHISDTVYLVSKVKNESVVLTKKQKKQVNLLRKTLGFNRKHKKNFFFKTLNV